MTEQNQSPSIPESAEDQGGSPIIIIGGIIFVVVVAAVLVALIFMRSRKDKGDFVIEPLGPTLQQPSGSGSNQGGTTPSPAGGAQPSVPIVKNDEATVIIPTAKVVEKPGASPASGSVALPSRTLFAYQAGTDKSITISDSCKDAYYVILIFSAKDAEKKDPASAKFNRASSCPALKKFTEKVELKPLNLPTGDYYYFVADQGASGTWYNPR